MRVDMVRQGCKCFEPTVANITFMRSVFRVRFHVSGQQVALRAGVVAVGTRQVRGQVGEHFLGCNLQNTFQCPVLFNVLLRQLASFLLEAQDRVHVK